MASSSALRPPALLTFSSHPHVPASPSSTLSCLSPPGHCWLRSLTTEGISGCTPGPATPTGTSEQCPGRPGGLRKRKGGSVTMAQAQPSPFATQGGRGPARALVFGSLCRLLGYMHPTVIPGWGFTVAPEPGGSCLRASGPQCFRVTRSLRDTGSVPPPGSRPEGSPVIEDEPHLNPLGRDGDQLFPWEHSLACGFLILGEHLGLSCLPALALPAWSPWMLGVGAGGGVRRGGGEGRLESSSI